MNKEKIIKSDKSIIKKEKEGGVTSKETADKNAEIKRGLVEKIDSAIKSQYSKGGEVRIDIGYAPQEVGTEIQKKYQDAGWKVIFDYKDKTVEGIVMILN